MRDNILRLLHAAGPAGASAEVISVGLDTPPSRATLNRQLAALREEGLVKVEGSARATRYFSTSPFSRADIDAYFERPAATRPVAPFREEYLASAPGIDAERAQRCVQVQALANPLDRKYLAEFLVDFTWASSLLEGSSYSELDTEALVRYGERNKEKPVEDAVLALNHKRAGEHLWSHRDLTVENLCSMHALLTDDHGMESVSDSDHFLPEHERGVPRVHKDVSLQNSAYLPPYRPGSQHARHMLEMIIDTARQLTPGAPVEASVYLLTRIAYVQSFSNGNKRTARLAANIPLLAAGLVPFSFVDVNKADYIRGMAAFYELGSIHVIEQTFISGYVKSIVRSSNLPLEMRRAGFDVDGLVRSLVDFINTGKRPAGVAEALLKLPDPAARIARAPVHPRPGR
jgi:hypothetical protein